jgi:hypothetical protein
MWQGVSANLYEGVSDCDSIKGKLVPELGASCALLVALFLISILHTAFSCSGCKQPPQPTGVVMQPAGMVMQPAGMVMQPVVQPMVVQQPMVMQPMVIQQPMVMQQQQQMAVNVPLGIEPGQAFMVQAPNGQQLQVSTTTVQPPPLLLC